MNWTAQQIQVAKNIDTIARKYGTIPSIIMLAVALQESGLNEQANNAADAPAYGGSWGIFQLNQDPRAHPDTKSMAISPWYDYGYHEIESSWVTAWGFFGAWSGFLVSPASFLANFAPKAQGSIAWDERLANQHLAEASELLELI